MLDASKTVQCAITYMPLHIEATCKLARARHSIVADASRAVQGYDQAHRCSEQGLCTQITSWPNTFLVPWKHGDLSGWWPALWSVVRTVCLATADYFCAPFVHSVNILANGDSLNWASVEFQQHGRLCMRPQG